MKITSSEKLIARMNWYEKMAEAYKHLSPEQLHQLQQWQQDMKPGQDLADWPGWETLIGKQPGFP